METLRPSSVFKIVWQIADPNDTTTYYPQAVIRNSVLGTTLDTVNLASEGSGRYSYSYQVPQDTSGMGMQIDITINVYTDSGHTTFSSNYQIENRVYKILEESKSFGGGGMVDYYEIEKIVKKVIENIAFPEYPQLDKIEDLQMQIINLGKKIEDENTELAKKTSSKELQQTVDELKKNVVKIYDDMEDIKNVFSQNVSEIKNVFSDKVAKSLAQKDEIIAQLSKDNEARMKAKKAIELFKKIQESVEEIRTPLDDMETEEKEDDDDVKGFGKKDFSKVARLLAMR